MKAKTITVSGNFKKMTIRAILSILFFVFTYLLLILFAVGLTILCGYGGMKIIIAKPMFLTFMVGIGLISMGVLILIFLLKFISKKHIVDRSHLIEISKEDEPKLFEFITEIVSEVKTDFPKKVYLSADVNASVFYDSSFWSMFFPIKKNLQIGVGLINSVTVIELKAILAHEFGHFSQRSMKVGSYVYNVNQVIYNLLYDNDSFNSLAQSWANLSSYFSLFVQFAVAIVHGIQRVLGKVYQVVNLSYMSLSREMEFHADEVAANVAGSTPLITSLLRLDLANHSYDTVINYYNSKIPDSIKTQNIFPQQQFVMNFFARENEMPVENNLPIVSMDFLNRYNKSKLIIKNQWASHPGTEDRIQMLEKLNIKKDIQAVEPASVLFSNISDIQSRATENLFSAVIYKGPVVLNDSEKFIEEFTTGYNANAFSKIFNTYFDKKNPADIDFEKISTLNQPRELNLSELFGNAVVDLIYTSISLEKDIHTIKQIANGELKIKSFDYDGNKFHKKNCGELISKMELELAETKEKIAANDSDIYLYFLSLAVKQDKENELKLHYHKFMEMNKAFNSKMEIYIEMVNKTGFIQQRLPYEQIEQNVLKLNLTEHIFKKQIQSLMAEDLHQTELNAEIREVFTKYLYKDWAYFNSPAYYNDSLNVLFNAINAYHFIISKTYFRIKKQLLEYFSELEIQARQF